MIASLFPNRLLALAAFLVALLFTFSPSAHADVAGFTGFASMNSSGAVKSVGLSDDKATLTLTDGGISEAGSAFQSIPQTVAGFHAEFTYQADNFGGPPPGGADGATFILQNDPRGVKALGGAGGGLGYGVGDGGTAIGRSAAFQLGIYPTSGAGVGTDGSVGGLGDTEGVDLRSGHPVRVTLDYDGATLLETLKDLVTGQVFTGEEDLDLPAALGGGSAFVGFSGGSGATTARQTVRDFVFQSKPATAHPAPPVKMAPKMPLGHHTLASYVDPMIGTDGGGDTLPGAGAPFGMTLFSPDTHAPSVGYFYSDHRIEGFSLTHMSGVGCDDEGDVFLTATTGPVKTKTAEYASAFRHDGETASAGYYQVHLRRWKVNAELTATERTGLIRFTFPSTAPGNILIPISHTLTHTSDAEIHIVGNDTVEGSVRSQSFCGAPAYYTTYFTLKLDRPFGTFGTFAGDTRTDSSRDAAQTGPNTPGVGAYLRFPARYQPFTVTARIGISYVDIAGARRNLAQEVGTHSFDEVRKATEAVWDKELHKIEITGGTEAQRTIFYTSLYHSFLMPSVASDVDGRYLGYDNAIHSVKPGHPLYADFSGWDIYRTEAPLLALVQPKRLQDMCQSIALMYQQGGWIDRWPQANTYTNVMCGSPLTTVAATAWNVGLHGFDMAALYPGMYKDATEAPPPNKPFYGEGNVGYMDSLGYIPDDKEGYGSVSQTEEDCYAYAALASVAASLGKTRDAQFLAKRALNYRHLFDPDTKFLRPKLANGAWYGPFDPTQEHGYVEGTGWHYRWLVQHDVGGLIDLFGGDAPFNAELDKFFGYAHPGWTGQYYNPYNETDLQAPFLYDYSGAPWKTQARVRELLADAYGTTPTGIPGNDDCGTMSAWYVFAALGLYPTDPARPAYELAAPLFPKAVVHLEAPYPISSFTVEAPNTSAANIYLRGLQVGGQTWPKPWLTQADIARGKTLKYTLGAEPDKGWGTGKEARPPSLGQ
jgi:predicted alpha-1,2-mannosidase